MTAYNDCCRTVVGLIWSLNQFETVIWRDQQNYLYLTANDVLVFASPSGGWRIEGVWVLSGNESQTAWLSSDGQIWLFDWISNPTATNIDAPEVVGIFFG